MLREEERAGGGELAAFVRRERDRIVADWDARAGRLPRGRAMQRSAARRAAPAILDVIARRAQGEEVREIEGGAANGRVLEPGFEASDVVAEFGLLRDCILRAAAAEGLALDDREARTVHDTIDWAMAVAVARHTEARERMLGAFDRISRVVLGSQDRSIVIPRLLRVLLETTAEVDSAVVMLREGDELVLKATAGLEEKLESDFRMRIGEGFSGRIAAEKRPLALRVASADPIVRSPIARSRGLRALYGMPLLHEGEVIGVALIGSLTAYEFSEEDLALFRSMAGQLTALLAHVRAAEQREQARQRAEHTLALLDSVLASSTVGLAFVDRDRRFVRVNGIVAAINGRPIEEHLGRRVEEIAPSEFGGRIAETIQRVLETGQPVIDVDFELPRPDLPGSPRYWVAHLYPVRMPGGEIVGVGSIVLNVTPRRRFREALKQTERRFTLALRNSGIVVFEQDRELRYRWVFNSQFGFNLEDVAGKNEWELYPDKDEVERIQELKLRSIKTKQPARGQFTITRDGQRRWFQTEVEPIFDESGEVVGIAGAATNITELKRYEEQLVRTGALRDRFLGVLGHDLRDPLSAIKASIQLLLRTRLTDGQARLARRVASGAEKMARLISSLLDFARAEVAGGIPVEPRPGAFGEIVARAVEELRLAHPRRQIDFERSGDTRGMWDPDRLAQVVGNLVGNAIRRSPPEEPVRVRVSGEDPHVVLSVHNGGPPITEDAQRELFAPFRMDAGAATPLARLGLGLYIVKSIADAHGASVEVRSTASEGTTFTTRWPREPPGSAPPGRARRRQER